MRASTDNTDLQHSTARKHRITKLVIRYLVRMTAIHLLLISLALHVWIASIRGPVSPAMGAKINAPSNWSKPDPKRFRVATYNIRRGKGLDDVRDLRRTAEILRNADITCLNEVGGSSFFGAPNQAQQLGEMLDMGWLFAPNQRRWYRDYFGSGLLSRFEVTRWFREQLVHDENISHSYRNLLTAELSLAGQPVAILVTHLDRARIQDDQLRYIFEKFTRYDRAILMGDFNAIRDHPQLTGLLSDANNLDAIADAPGSGTTFRIDWIITRGFDVVDKGASPAGVSDHPYYWVDLALRQKKPINGPKTQNAGN